MDFRIPILIVLAVLPVFIFAAIFRKAGYSPWLGLLMIVPVINLAWLIAFAFSEWRIQREVALRRGLDGDATANDMEMLIIDADRLERSGDLESAASAFERMANMPNHPDFQYAANSARRIRELMHMRAPSR